MSLRTCHVTRLIIRRRILARRTLGDSRAVPAVRSMSDFRFSSQITMGLYGLAHPRWKPADPTKVTDGERQELQKRFLAEALNSWAMFAATKPPGGGRLGEGKVNGDTSLASSVVLTVGSDGRLTATITPGP